MKLKYFLIFFVMLTSRNFFSAPLEKDILEKIFNHAENTIERIEEGKIFFKPQAIQINGGKIFLINQNEEQILLPYICSDGEQLFLAPCVNYREMWICTTPTCQWAYDYPPNICSNCNGTTFRYRKLPDRN